jgi:hypothetical protein
MELFPAGNFANKFLKQEQERGFNIEFVGCKGNLLSHSINQTMMRIDLASNEAR